MRDFDSPRLMADIGSTFARFALETAPGEFEHVVSLRCDEHADFHAAVRAYMDQLPPLPIDHAAVAIANPVDGDLVRMTNYHWSFSIEETRLQLGLETLVVVNDFTALAMALPRLRSTEVRQVGGGEARPHSVMGLLGAGSGLGVSGLIPAGDGWVSLGSEGGHTTFAPRDDREIALLRFAWNEFQHVSFERLLSGPGLELIYRAMAAYLRRPPEALSAPDITARALEGSDLVCGETLELFCTLMGTAAANLAVTLGAHGGIYIGGGIVPRLGEYFDRSRFRERFEDKGRFSPYVAAIPTFVITAEHATFTGTSAILEAQLRSLQSSSSSGTSAILGQIRRARDNLSPAEQRVADHVLAHSRKVLNDPIAEIAKAANVSQPTVIRFCRSLGCEGLSDFKLRLASGLTGTVPVSHTQVTQDDSMVELGEKVLGNTASAILQVRSQLNRDMIDRSIELLLSAARIEFFAVGHYGVVAQDAQFKFLRLGMACNAYVEPRLQLLAAQTLRAGDVAVLISGSGKVPELIAVADAVKERGAAVLAITASQSPLAKKADALLIVDHVEDVATHMPMISRILHLLVIDMMAVGVAMRRDPAHQSIDVPTLTVDPESDHREPQPGLRAGAGSTALATPLSNLTAHSR
ncbi:glucokinase [Roseateles depolymerans]|uniref:Glucokinase n=1 Tax=Roseateles depolymerans TaxID=76731 RepID=A0A0U3LNW6_9BURK|nr:glucokinase [Roseateles depolymerans]ALV08130.1 RpiR family transcriptional regulator [Roseateles depolymerans]REG21648.1 RpiR family transcriptional regulator [Roseateles depolymerans]